MTPDKQHIFQFEAPAFCALAVLVVLAAPMPVVEVPAEDLKRVEARRRFRNPGTVAPTEIS